MSFLYFRFLVVVAVRRGTCSAIVDGASFYIFMFVVVLVRRSSSGTFNLLLFVLHVFVRAQEINDC